MNIHQTARLTPFRRRELVTRPRRRRGRCCRSRELGDFRAHHPQVAERLYETGKTGSFALVTNLRRSHRRFWPPPGSWRRSAQSFTERRQRGRAREARQHAR